MLATRRFFTGCFLATLKRCQLPAFAFTTFIDTNTTSSYIPFVFVFYFMFECRNLFHLTLMDERAFILVHYLLRVKKVWWRSMKYLFCLLSPFCDFLNLRIKRWWWTQVSYRKSNRVSHILFPCSINSKH